MIRKFWPVILCCAPAMAAISGTVVNGTTGKPEPGITVSTVRMTQRGPEPGPEVKADAQGKFSINEQPQGPMLIRATIDGVTYNRVLPPGQPTDGVTLSIYNASREKGSAKVSKHMIFFEPSGKDLTVVETYIYANNGKTAWNDPNNGTLHFYMPPGAEKVQLNGTAPGGMALQEIPEKIGRGDTYKVNFPVRPGETRFDLNYQVPYTEGTPYKGKIATDDENTYLIVPSGVTLTGKNLNDLGEEPRTKAHIYGLKGSSYEVTLAGSFAPPPQSADSGDAGAQDGQPPIQEIMPRLYGKKGLILALALGILGLGFVLLYRMPATANGSGLNTTREPNERRRR